MASGGTCRETAEAKHGIGGLRCPTPTTSQREKWMRSLHRRIAVLERSAAVQHQHDEPIVKQVLHKLSPQEMELLILASVADREGRALTELEWAARQAYRLALLQECVVAGRRPTEGLEAPSALHQILVSAHL